MLDGVKQARNKGKKQWNLLKFNNMNSYSILKLPKYCELKSPVQGISDLPCSIVQASGNILNPAPFV